MAKLAEIGFLKDVVGETIISTYNGDGTPNAAPMGVIMVDERHVAVNLYNTSATLTNVKARRCAVLNLTDDINVYYRTAFKEANPNSALPREWFTKTQTVDAPKLVSAQATIDVSVADLEEVSKEKTKATFIVDQVQATPRFERVYCRAFGATVEAIIYATRVKILVNDETEQKRVSQLLERIQLCCNIVDHVAPNSAYSVIMADLTKRIAVWVKNEDSASN